MFPSPAGREASSGGSAPPYVHRRPERTLLYQLVEEYYAAFKAHLAVRALFASLIPEQRAFVRCCLMRNRASPRKLLIFGNSGSGKTTLAKSIVRDEGIAHLDLDSLAWTSTEPPERSPISEATQKIEAFIRSNAGWVIEGCYTDLLEIAAGDANEAIFLNLSIEQCIENARHRPWEPHKYRSREDQDRNLGMLIAWISQYAERTDVFSLASHMQLYQGFNGKKTMLDKH